MLDLLLTLQIFHVAFLLPHDWIPLGAFNDIAAVRAENPIRKLVLTTLSTLPFALALAFSLQHQRTGYPPWLLRFLWLDYVLLFVGELQAWWFPYVRGAKPERIARYNAMFGRTHAFLPARNGIRINTLHVLLHTFTVATLIVLGIVTAQGAHA